MGEVDLEFVNRAGHVKITANVLFHHPTYYPEHTDIDADIQYLVHPDCYSVIPLLLLHISGSH